MAIKPIMNAVQTFDPEYAKVFTFTWSGNQIQSNRLVITNNATGSVSYDQTITTYKLEHELPGGGTLTPSTRYSAQIQVTDTFGNVSALSDKVFFYVLTTPTFAFSNATEGQVIASSSFYAILSYSQNLGELLKDFYFQLYDSGYSLLYNSDTSYDTSTLSYKYQSLENDTFYYIRAKGETVNGMPVDTGYVGISVKYINPSMYTNFELENKDGYIRYATNLIIIDCTNPSGEYIYDGGYIDLRRTRSGTDRIAYQEGFSLSTDYQIMVEAKGYFGALYNGHDLYIGNKDVDAYRTIVFARPTGEDNEYVFILTEYATFSAINGTTCKTLIHSNKFNVTSDEDKFLLTIKRSNSIYQLTVVKE